MSREKAFGVILFLVIGSGGTGRLGRRCRRWKREMREHAPYGRRYNWSIIGALIPGKMSLAEKPGGVVSGGSKSLSNLFN